MVEGIRVNQNITALNEYAAMSMSVALDMCVLVRI